MVYVKYNCTLFAVEIVDRRVGETHGDIRSRQRRNSQ